MKVIICGGRDYIFSPKDVEFLDRYCKEHSVTEIVSGGARGADNCGEMYASLRGIPRCKIPAEWNNAQGDYDRSAGRKRNVKMAEYADACISFPGGRGTAHMTQTARAKGLHTVEVDTSNA